MNEATLTDTIPRTRPAHGVSFREAFWLWVRVGALKSRAMVALAALAFVGIFFFGVPFPIIIAAAAVIGFAGNATGLEWFRASGGHGPAASSVEGPAAIDEAFARDIPEHVQPSF